MATTKAAPGKKGLINFDFLQKLGKVLMTVIAVMPAAGLMISLGKLVLGTNFRFQLLGDQPLIKVVNNLNLMAEYDARTVNIGAHYQLWKDHINLIAELNNGKYFSGGIYFKIHLK